MKQIITLKCNKYTDLTLMDESIKEDENNNDDYDTFCKKIKDKTYKVGYSQFIGELFNKGIIEKKLVLNNINRQIDNLLELLKKNDNFTLIEDNLICVCQLIITTINKLIDLEYDIADLLKNLNIIENLITSKRLRFKIMDLVDRLNKCVT